MCCCISRHLDIFDLQPRGAFVHVLTTKHGTKALETCRQHRKECFSELTTVIQKGTAKNIMNSTCWPKVCWFRLVVVCCIRGIGNGKLNKCLSSSLGKLIYKWGMLVVGMLSLLEHNCISWDFARFPTLQLWISPLFSVHNEDSWISTFW